MKLKLKVTPSATKAELAKLVSLFGSLPKDYLEFLNKHNGVEPPSNKIKCKNTSSTVREFTSAKEILAIAGTIDEFPAAWLPIAFDHSGNYFGLDPKTNQVHFWDHEIDEEDVLSDNFQGFLNKLEPFDLSEIDWDPSDEISGWTNPDFKPEF
jgi:cell wall assembly regulator SMI1